MDELDERDMDCVHPSEIRLELFVLKVASRCNLNCSYCYMYNKGDDSWRSSAIVMPDATFEATVERIRRHCLFTGQSHVALEFHGGEPSLVGAKQFDSWCQIAQRALNGVTRLDLGLQTNGTLLDEEWAEILSRHNVQVGVSMDGPKEIHNLFRIDHRGTGSYTAVVRGIQALKAKGIPFTILAVVQPGVDPITVHRHFLDLGPSSIAYLLPDYTHDTIAPVRELYGPTPCADFLIPIFDEWWFNGTIELQIREFWNIARLILGGSSKVDSVGSSPMGFITINTDGAIQGLDVLRTCPGRPYETGLNVHTADFRDIAERSDFNARLIAGKFPLPLACHPCPERQTCAGGYLPHRYSSVGGFDNASVWCADLLRIFGHIRDRMGVSVQETERLRRQSIVPDALAAE